MDLVVSLQSRGGSTLGRGAKATRGRGIGRGALTSKHIDEDGDDEVWLNTLSKLNSTTPIHKTVIISTKKGNNKI